MSGFVFFIISSLLVLVPLLFSPKSSELFEFPKMLLIYFGSSLLLFPTIYRLKKVLKQKKSSFSQRRTLIRLVFASFSVFFISQLLSTVFSIDRHVSVFGYYSRFNGGLLSLASYLIIFTSVFLFVDANQLKKLLKVVLFSGLFVALWGFPSHFGYDFICLLVLGKFNTSCWTSDFVPQLRMFSTIGQPNWFATYLLILIFLVIYYITIGSNLLPKKFKQFDKYFLWILFILFSVELVWTNSRSGILSYIVLVPSYFLLLFYRSQTLLKKNFRRIWLVPVIVFIAIFLTQAFPYLSRFYNKIATSPPTSSKALVKPNEQNTTKVTASSDIRLLVWEGAFRLSRKYPVLGTGVETFAYSYHFTRPVEHNVTSEWNFTYNKAHNELLNYLATTGYVGLASYLLMFGAFTLPALSLLLNKKSSQLDRTTQHFTLFYLISMLSVFIMNFFGFSTTLTSLFFYLLPALFLVQLINEQNTNTDQSTNSMVKQLTFNQLAVYFMWILFVFVYLLNYFTADYNYARAREYKQIQDFDNAQFYNQKAIDIRMEPTYLDQQAVLSANLATLEQIQHNNPQVKQLTEQAKKYNNLTLQISPQNVFYYKTRAKIYYLLSLNNIDKPDIAFNYFQNALKALKQAAVLAPTDPTVPFTQASLVYNQDPDKALELIHYSLKLKPDYTEAKEMLKRLQN